jgi:hypothetical protein
MQKSAVLSGVRAGLPDSLAQISSLTLKFSRAGYRQSSFASTSAYRPRATGVFNGSFRLI